MHRVIHESDLESFAQELARELGPGSNIYLSGELGAGKTTFTRALLEALGSDKPATSPTFALVNQHKLNHDQRAWHVDLYRLDNPEDVFSLGLLDAISDPLTTVIVEWPEKGDPILPKPDVHLHFSHHTPDTRVVTKL